jgi:hypothetical protein
VRRVALYAWWALVIAGWAATILEIDRITQGGDAQVVLAFGTCVAAGFLIGRWWALGVPAAAFLVAVVYGAIAGADHGDASAVVWFILGLVLVALAAAGVAVGVVLGRVVRAAAHRVAGADRAG